MRNTIHKSEAIRIILGILFLLAILAFYPFRLLTGKIAFSPKESGRASVSAFMHSTKDFPRLKWRSRR